MIGELRNENSRDDDVISINQTLRTLKENMNNSTEVIVTEQSIENESSEDKERIKNGRNGMQKLIEDRKEYFTAFTVLAIFTAYFSWATYHYLQNSSTTLESFGFTTCTGYGFLVILYCLFIFGYLNVFVLKPFVFPLINIVVCKPITDVINDCTERNLVLSALKRRSSIIFYVAVIILAGIYLAYDTKDNRHRLVSISGLFIFLLIGYICSNNRSKIQWRPVLWGIILQFLFGLITIRWEVGRNILDCIGNKVNTLLGYAFTAAEFPFGEELIKNQQVFAFRALSTIYFISFLVNLLYYYGVMEKIVVAIGSLLQYIMGTTICESVNSAANIFLSMTEAPLLIAPYLKNLTDSEIHSIMTSGFATVAGSVMAGYISYGARPQDLITSSIMSAPAALCFSKLMHPETEEVKVLKDNIEQVEMEYKSALDAVSKGVANAVNLVHGIVAGLIAYLAAVYFVNGILGWMGELVGFTDPTWSLDLIAGKIFIPVSYVMGVPWSECENVATLIGIKTMVNEFVAFQKMGTMLDAGLLSDRTKVIATYAICGFSNPSSFGIMASALSALIPDRTDVISRVITRAWFGGALVCLMTACIAGVLMPDDAISSM